MLFSEVIAYKGTMSTDGAGHGADSTFTGEGGRKP